MYSIRGEEGPRKQYVSSVVQGQINSKTGTGFQVFG